MVRSEERRVERDLGCGVCWVMREIRAVRYSVTERDGVGELERVWR